MYISFKEAEKLKITRTNSVNALVHIEIARTLYGDDKDDTIKKLMVDSAGWEHIVLPKAELDNIQRVLAKNWALANRLTWKTPALVLSLAVNVYLILSLLGV